MKTKKNKTFLIEQLKKTPIVEIACQKSGISRSTFYRWKKEDVEFAKKADDALYEGTLLVNDMAESQLMSAIKDKNMTAIIFWLKHRHPVYANKIEITATRGKGLSEEQLEELIELLYGKSTFSEGEKLLTSYVLKGQISETLANLVLKVFLSHIKTEDILTKKKEADLLSEVMLREERSER